MQGQNISVIAGADYSASTNLGLAVKLSVGATNSTLPTCVKAGANEQAEAIITKVPEGNGYSMTVCVHGFVKAKAGETFAVGTELKTDADGKLVAAGGTGDDKVIAIAYEAATAVDQLVLVYKKDLHVK